MPRISVRSVPLPKLIECLREGYTAKLFLADIVAGITVGLVALPLAMAFAIASGVPPQNGLYCAVIAGFTISALGGSRVQIGGPTGAFVVVVSGIVATYGLEGLFVCTVMAGVILLLLGLTGLGTAVKYIPRPVVIGFTNGIAILIASTQIRDFFGLQTPAVPGDFLGRMRVLASSAGTASIAATLLAVSTVGVILICRRLSRRIPGSIIALLAGTVIVFAAGLPVETIGTRFGSVPRGFPPLRVPPFSVDLALTAEASSLPKVVVLRLRNMTAIDGTGLHAIERFADVLHESGRTLLLCGMRDQPARMMARAEFHRHIGAENMVPSLEDALTQARTLLSASGEASPRRADG